MNAPVSVDFLHRELPAVGKRVHRLGLALNFGLDPRGLETALERGLGYLFYWQLRSRGLEPVLKRALARDREKLVVATSAAIGFFGSTVRSHCEGMLRRLGTDYLDVYQLGWLGTASAWTPATVDAMLQLKREGKVRAVGVSIHDRARAGRLAEDSPLDLLMLRYNAAHPGAERDVFPHLARRKPAVVAYTATAWRRLLKAPRGWSGPTMTAGDCYRFCLSSPSVDVVLQGPANLAQLEENLAAVARGPLEEAELTWMREYGRLVHG
jgi:aryl-alcohol dehydrogenase-like predicted oxidoreductase